MTLYDELVKLFREHEARWVRIDRIPVFLCRCTEKFEMRNHHDKHLAALACERAEQVIRSVKPQRPPLVQFDLGFEAGKNAVIAALGEVKRG